MSTTALAVIQPDELDTIQRTGRLLAASGYFDAKGEGAQAIAMMATKILAGREIGIGPFASVNGIHIISGKPAIGANLMASAIKGSGRYDYRVLELTEKICRIEYRQRNGDKWEIIGISEFTAEDARKAGTKNMDKYPKNMLFARAMSNGVRFYTPDIFSGNAIYIPEELGADVDMDGNVVEVAPRIVESPIIQRPERVEVEADGDVLFEKPSAKESPPHQRLFGIGLSTFGADWNDGARYWLIGNWTAHVAKSDLRTSASALSNDEKDLLADYIKANATALQRKWKAHKASEMQSSGELVPEPA